MEINEIIESIQWTNSMWAVLTPLILIILDVLTGVVKAWKNNNFDSSKMRAGLSKKFGEIIYILVGMLSKYAIGTEAFLWFLVGYICVMEISSLLENCDELGVAIPEKLKEKLNNIDKKSGD